MADTGTGVAEADREQVFEAFHRGSPPAPGSAPGLGLGLSLVKSFVELHSGRVEFISRPGAGTRVLCYLPKRPTRRDDAPAPAAAGEAESS